MSEFEVNKPPLILKEYGRNVQKLVAYLSTVEDKETRTRYAHSLVDLMKQINPAFKETNETTQKLWDDLFIMSDFTLDVESPYPVPPKDILGKKPKKMDYNVHRIKYKHYGHNIYLMIQKAIEMEDPEEREAATIYIGRLMKGFYTIWNKENIDDVVIVDNIKELSNGQLDMDVNKVKENNLFESTYKEKPRSSSSSGSSKSRKYTGGRKRKN
ncbi:MAG: DUF4290 domain-containing protein [Candidatus Cyclobacteriaceae bacterium M3_2C_046]